MKEKEQKRQQANGKRDSEQITKENRKEQLKAKQPDSRNFINNQKQQAANQERTKRTLTTFLSIIVLVRLN
jgi:hypothetical protein